MPNITPVLLLILDGFGYREALENNAILAAKTPNLNRLKAEYAFGTIEASESFVGLPRGQFGNSEVGHLNIGAGRIVQQDISRIDVDIEQGTFKTNPTLQTLFAQTQNNTLHIMALLSDGGVHSHENHIFAAIDAAVQSGVARVQIHAFLDGRDTPPRSAHTYLLNLDKHIQAYDNVVLASVTGRYWAMDRDKRWDRVKFAYDAIVDTKPQFWAKSGIEALELAYARDENDEFVQASCIDGAQAIALGDSILFMNFRADRARQLCDVLTHSDFNEFATRPLQLTSFVTLTSYGEAYTFPVCYAPQSIENGLGEYLSNQKIAQLRIAETEKYPHVTYFFNGGVEQAYPLEDRVLIPSPKVATYDLQPQMSAELVTEQVCKAIISKQYSAIICNYANGDMVGHTGVFDAAVLAVETLDHAVGICVETMLAAGGEVIISADHGNIEQMFDTVHNQVHTQHTTDPVPFIYIGRKARIKAGGSLRDIAPSMLAIMGLEQPAQMTGHSLIEIV